MEFVSDGGAALTGYQPNELVGDGPTSYGGLIHVNDRQILRDEVQRALREGRRFQLEYRITTRTGRTRWVWEQGRGLFGADGEVLALEGFITDIDALKRKEAVLTERAHCTERHNAEFLASKGALERAVEELTRANGELDDFAYIVSHDLKEPLRGIQNYAAFLLDDYGDRIDEEGRTKLNTVVRLSQRLNTLIDTLLDCSRLGRTEPTIKPTNLDEVLDDVLDSLHAALHARGVEIRRPQALLPTIPCDRVRVTELFQNLITNAFKYNDKPDPWIEIGHQDQGGMPVTLYVRDNGIGIAEKHHDAVFRIFKRLHGRDQYGGGSGAGLTIVQRIVTRHGGRIWLQSQPGVGTTFSFTLRGDHQHAPSRGNREAAGVID